MLNEKHNDPFGWKNKLEGLNRLPGEAALDKGPAWEILHGRLQQKVHRSKATWYWAAACILLACIIPLMIANRKENIVVKSDPPQKQHAITAPEQLQTLPPAPVTVNSPVQDKKIQVENSTTKDKHITTLKTPVKQHEPVTSIAEAIEKDALTTITPAPNTDTVVNVTAAVPGKKKLSVVHINEVDAPAAPVFPPSNYVQRSVRIKLGNKKAANQTIASQQQTTDGFKIKLSSKN